MNKKLLIALGGLALLALGFLVGFKLNEVEKPSTAPLSYDAALDKFQQVFRFVNATYFESIDNGEMVEEAIKGMLGSLDPHTIYISANEMKQENELYQGHFDGIGVEFNILADTIFVVTPLVGGPSERLGILAGDRIVRIDGKTVAGTGITNNDVFKYLRGPKGSNVTVSVARRGAAELIDFQITRDKIPVFSVAYSYMMTPTTGYIRVVRFAETTHREFVRAITKLKAAGMTDLVLDLRGNPGGLMQQAKQMSDEFLGEGKLVVYSEGRAPQANDRYDATALYDSWEKGGLVILIDESSASASEIVSGAVQDWDRGVLVGVRSFGKGLVQMPYTLPDGSSVRVVISRYYTPSGRCIQKPFKGKDAETYHRELTERWKSGESFDPDKVKFPDSLKYKTKRAGRTVFGGGAVMPDVFVQNDTSGYSNYFFQLINKRVFTEFGVRYLDRNPTLKTTYTSGFDFAKRFEITPAITQECLAFGADHGVKLNPAEAKKSRDWITNQIKAQIGHAAFGDDGMWPVFHQSDNQVTTALSCVKAAREMEQTGALNLASIQKPQPKRSQK
jgi:carboxyl-terminal processing protease